MDAFILKHAEKIMDRLETIVHMVDVCAVAADIGTDHGYVPEMMLKRGLAKRVIATDINEGPLSRAVEHLSSSGCGDACEFRLGSGLKVLKPGEAECIVIAGMGGELIASILDESRAVAQKARQLILQPMTAADKLRLYLRDNGYSIVDENASKELYHYYFIVKAVAGKSQHFDDIYTEFSQHLIEKKDRIMYEYMGKCMHKNQQIIESLLLSGKSEYRERIDALKHKNEVIKELMNTYEA